MIHKPHIVLEDGLWRLYPRKGARNFVAQCRDFQTFIARVKKRHEQSIHNRQNRELGRAARLAAK